MHSLEWTKYYTLPWQDGKDPIRSTSFWKFWACGGCEGAQWKLYVCLLAYKSAEQPWEAPCGLTFTGCSLFPCHHISLCFYSKSLSPSAKRRRGLLIASRWGGGESIKWIQIGWSTCHRVLDCWLRGLNSLHYFCMPHSESVYRAERQWRSRVAVNFISERSVAWGRAHLFV